MYAQKVDAIRSVKGSNHHDGRKNRLKNKIVIIIEPCEPCVR